MEEGGGRDDSLFPGRGWVPQRGPPLRGGSLWVRGGGAKEGPSRWEPVGPGRGSLVRGGSGPGRGRIVFPLPQGALVGAVRPLQRHGQARGPLLEEHLEYDPTPSISAGSSYSRPRPPRGSPWDWKLGQESGGSGAGSEGSERVVGAGIFHPRPGEEWSNRPDAALFSAAPVASTSTGLVVDAYKSVRCHAHPGRGRRATSS